MAKNVVIKVMADVASAIGNINKVSSAAMGMGAKFKAVGAGIAGFGRNMAALTTLPIVAGLGVAVKKALDFDKAISGASRAVGLTANETKAWSSEILKVAPSLGMMPAKFAEVVTEAAKLGIAKNEVIGFSEAIAKFSMITDSDPIENSKMFAALKTVTKMSNAEMLNLMATANKLDDAIGSSSKEILSFVQETAGAGKILGISTHTLAAFGATMQSIGIKTAVSYRAMNKMMTVLAAPQTLSDKAKGAFADIGLSAKGMGDLMAKDATKGITTFLGAIAKTSATNKQKALGAVAQIIGADFGDEILRTSLSLDKLSEAMGYSTDRAGNMSKFTQEVAQKLGGASGSMAVFMSRLEAFGILVGGVLIPVLNKMLGAINPVLEDLNRFATANPKIVQLGVVIGIAVAAIAPLIIGIGMVVSAIGSIGAAIGAALPIIGGIVAAIGTVVGAVVSAPGLIAVGIAALIAGVVAGVYAVYKNWDWLSRTTVGVFTGLMNWFNSNWRQVGTFILSPVTWAIGQFANAYGQARQAGWGLINAFYEGIRSVVMAPVNLVKDMVNNIRNYLPGSDAKLGALSDLTAAGAALPATFAVGANSNMAPVSQAANNIGNAALPQARAPMMTGGGNSTVTLNFNPQVTVTGGGTQEDGRRLVEVMRPFAREFMLMIQQVDGRATRTQNI